MNDSPKLTEPSSVEMKPPPATDGKFTLYSASDFPNLLPMDWLINNVLPTSGLACIYGPSGVGKSFFCLGIAVAVAGADNWFGHKTQLSRVVYIALEGQSGFRRRVKAKEIQQGKPLSNLVKFVFDSFDMTELDNALQLGKLIRDEGGADLIVIDTLNRASPGADENSSSAMGDIIQSAEALRILTGAMVLFVHHPGKDATRGLRGHSSLFAAMDTVIEVVQDGQNIRWKLAKSKDSDDRISHAFKLLPIEIGKDGAGQPITSCVVQEVEGAPSSTEAPTEPTGVNQQVILQTVRGILVDRRMQCTLDDSDLTEGVMLEEIEAQLKDTLHWIGPKHRQSRTKEAMTALIRMGYFMQSANMLTLPAN